MKNAFKTILLLLFTSFSLFAQNWSPTTGSVKFSLKMLGVMVDGKLGGIKANLNFDNNTPTSIYASVETKTIDTDNSLRDSHLKEKPEFFQPEKYPTIVMNSKSITKTSKGFEGLFDVTIKGITKSVKVPFTFLENGSTGTFSGQFVIDRTDWKFGGNTFGMGDDVKINVSLNVKK
jgi:polyisoprenoid-binding protein YceI